MILGEGKITQDWLFETNEEKMVADALGNMANTNGMSRNDFRNVFPAILRIVKHKSKWSE